MDDLIESTLVSREGQKETFGPNDVLWVPPVVDVRDLPPIGALRDYRYRYLTPRQLPESIPYIAYPVSWISLSEAMLHEAPDKLGGPKWLRVIAAGERAIDEGWQWGPRVQSITANDLIDRGWHRTTEITKLVDEFLALAVHPVAPETSQQVKAFVQRWGPLWLCRAPNHVDCHWGPQWHPDLRHSPCQWAAVEEVWHFVRKAWEARAILEVVKALQRHVPISPEIWPYLACLRAQGGHKASDWFKQYNDADYKWLVTTTINRYLAPRVAQGPRLLMDWEESGQPTLHFYCGMGFLYAFWFSIAQALSEAHGLLQCDECGKFYARQGRRPQSGRRNFCPACGTLASKRVWAREQRSQKPKNL